MDPTRKYIAAEELRVIADHCDTLVPVWDMLTTGSRDGMPTVEMADDMNFSFNIFDVNGHKLGEISWAEDGAAFYPTTEDD